MTYADLTTTELILLAVEFVGRGVPIPAQIQEAIGSDLVKEITSPEITDNGTQEN